MARMVVVTGWIVVAAGAALLITLVTDRPRSRVVVAGQALAPYLAAALAPAGVAGALARSWAVTGVAALTLIGFAVVGRRLLWNGGQPEVLAGARAVRVLHANLMYANRTPERLGELAASVDDVDVLAFTEYTPAHAAVLLAGPLADRFAHRVEHPAPGAAGAALWSRYPLSRRVGPPLHFATVAATVDSPARLTVIVVHPMSPMVSMATWRRDLATLATISPAGDPPTMIVGDFNASSWHPAFRRLLRAGWRDAHLATNRGFASTWPTNRRLPPFVGIDHYLLSDTVLATATAEVEVPGSDHRGIVVTVMPAHPPR